VRSAMGQPPRVHVVASPSIVPQEALTEQGPQAHDFSRGSRALFGQNLIGVRLPPVGVGALATTSAVIALVRGRFLPERVAVTSRNQDDGRTKSNDHPRFLNIVSQGRPTAKTMAAWSCVSGRYRYWPPSSQGRPEPRQWLHRLRVEMASSNRKQQPLNQEAHLTRVEAHHQTAAARRHIGCATAPPPTTFLQISATRVVEA